MITTINEFKENADMFSDFRNFATSLIFNDEKEFIINDERTEITEFQNMSPIYMVFKNQKVYNKSDKENTYEILHTLSFEDNVMTLSIQITFTDLELTGNMDSVKNPLFIYNYKIKNKNEIEKYFNNIYPQIINKEHGRDAITIFENQTDYIPEIERDEQYKNIKEFYYPKSSLSQSFQLHLGNELKKIKGHIFYVIEYDLYMDDEKLFTINPATDSVESIINKIKSETTNEKSYSNRKDYNSINSYILDEPKKGDIILYNHTNQAFDAIEDVYIFVGYERNQFRVKRINKMNDKNFIVLSPNMWNVPIQIIRK